MWNKVFDKTAKSVCCLALAFCASSITQAQDAPAIELLELSDSFYLAVGGRGANSEFLVGDDQVLLVDAKMTESAEDLNEAIQSITDKPVSYLINTHVHIDHTGGNSLFGEAGAVIVAQEETRDVLKVGQRGGPPAPASALPDITISSDDQIRLHFDGEVVEVIPVPPAHTTDNSIVYFHNANVYVLGDLYSPVRYPVFSGGTMQGYIDGVEKVLAMSDEDSLFVPGVGPNATNRTDLERYLDMLVSVRDRVAEMVDQGMDLEQIVAAKPTEGFDEIYGLPNHRAFLPVLVNQLGQ